MTASLRFVLTYVVFLGVVQYRFLLVYGDCWYDNKKYEENAEVPTGEPCLNCTCSKSVLVCYLRVCTKLPNPPPAGCILLHRYKTCCPELICSDFHDGGNSLEARADPEGDMDILSDDQSPYENACISNGSIYGPGSAMHSSSQCEYCYCLAGKQVCVKPKCLLPIEGCSPVFEDTSCCPVRYNCTNHHLPESNTEEATTVTSPNSVLREQGGCFVDGTHHQEGSKVIGVGHSVCDNCYCLRGLMRCEPLSCAPPLLGCAPVVKPGECCAASYNCNGTLEIEPEPNYGLFPTISKEYSKLRKEVHRKPPSKHQQNREGVFTVAPFYVLAETLQEPTTKLVYQRSPATYGTTRQFAASNTRPSSTQKTTSDEDNYFLISSSKQRSSTTEKPSRPGVYYATTNYEFQNTKFRRVYSTTSRTNTRALPTERVRTSTLNNKREKESNSDYIGLGNLNILSIVDSLLDGKMYRRVVDDTDDKQTVNSSDNSISIQSTTTTMTTTESSTVFETTISSTEVTDFSTTFVDYSTTPKSDIDDTTLGTTEDEIGPVTVTTVLKSTDCIQGIERNLEKGDSDTEITTVQPLDPAEINKLAESRTDFTTTTDIDSEESSSENSTTDEDTIVDVKSRNKLKINNSKLPPDIEAILNISKHKNSDDFDYDYNEPTLPPSLPNLKIIPFVAADALDAKKESPKDPTPTFIEEKIDTGPLEYTSNMFKPPVETEGGFVPKEPLIIDDFYNNVVSVPSITSESSEGASVLNCISNGQEILHGTSVPSDSPCVTCTCFYGNIVCQKSACPPPKPGCNIVIEQGVTLCCPNYICEEPLIPPLESPETSQEIVTVAQGIIPPDPFKDVIKTEPAPNLQNLIGDMILQKVTSTTPPPLHIEDLPPLTSVAPSKAGTTTPDDDEGFGFDKVLQFIFSGQPDVIEKPLSQTPSRIKNDTAISHQNVSTHTDKTTIISSVSAEDYSIATSTGADVEDKQDNKSATHVISTDKSDEINVKNEEDGKNNNSVGVGLLKLAGCNIYGRMYRVGRIISELSGPCMECKCTEIGVQCRQLRCTNEGSNKE